jgi:taurine dioxygenase
VSSRPFADDGGCANLSEIKSETLMLGLQIARSQRYAFGCRIEGVNIRCGVDNETTQKISEALNEHLVVCVSGEPYGPQALVQWAKKIGPLEINVSKAFQNSQYPQVMTLSNVIENGKPQGLADAGQEWHTDMSYNRIAGRATILHAHQVPFKDGRPLGDTAFRNMYAAYESLPQSLKDRLDDLEAVHDFENLWTHMRARPGSLRKPFTDAQRKEKPPVVHPVVLRHPWTGRKCLYVNRGLTTKILGLSESDSRTTLEFLFAHQEEVQFEYRHEWRVGDTLIWDNCASIHLATGGYSAEQPRVMIRTQILGDETRYRQTNGPLGGRTLQASRE